MKMQIKKIFNYYFVGKNGIIDVNTRLRRFCKEIFFVTINIEDLIVKILEESILTLYFEIF